MPAAGRVSRTMKGHRGLPGGGLHDPGVADADRRGRPAAGRPPGRRSGHVTSTRRARRATPAAIRRPSAGGWHLGRTGSIDPSGLGEPRGSPKLSPRIVDAPRELVGVPGVVHDHRGDRASLLRIGLRPDALRRLFTEPRPSNRSSRTSSGASTTITASYRPAMSSSTSSGTSWTTTSSCPALPNSSAVRSPMRGCVIPSRVRRFSGSLNTMRPSAGGRGSRRTAARRFRRRPPPRPTPACPAPRPPGRARRRR